VQAMKTKLEHRHLKHLSRNNIRIIALEIEDNIYLSLVAVSIPFNMWIKEAAERPCAYKSDTYAHTHTHTHTHLFCHALL